MVINCSIQVIEHKLNCLDANSSSICITQNPQFNLIELSHTSIAFSSSSYLYSAARANAFLVNMLQQQRTVYKMKFMNYGLIYLVYNIF